MAQTNVSFELNDHVKNQMNEICEDLGMSMDEAFQIFAAKMVNEQGIPFEITEKDFPDHKECPAKKAVKIGAIVFGLISLVGLIVMIARLFHKD